MTSCFCNSQITRSGIRLHIKWAVSIVISDSHINLFQGLVKVYCNSLLYGIPKHKTDRLQCVHNIAARIVARCPKFTNITPVFYELHWLPIYKRIVFKLLLLVYRSVNQLAPTYLCERVKPYEEVQMRDDLRSTTQHLLHVPRSGSVSFGDRSFRVAGPTEWNVLPLDIK